MCPVDSLRTETKFKKTEIGEIPVDWEIFRLGEIAHITMGQSPPSSSCFDYKNGLPFFQGKAEFGIKYPRILKWCHAPKKIADKEDILISVRAPVGDINVAPEKSCIGRGLAAIRAVKSDNEYLYYSLNYFKKKLAKIGQGSTFEAINKNDLFELAIPFPPLNEQISIARILKSVDEAIDKKREIIEKSKELKKCLMQELLTRGIGHTKFNKTEIGEIPAKWQTVQVKDVSEKPEYGYTASAIEKPVGPKLLRITDIQNGHVNWSSVPYCSCPDSIKKKYLLKSGVILFARTGATTGKSILIQDCPETVYASYLIRIVPTLKISSKFLNYVFNSHIYWKQIRQNLSGSAQGGINATFLSRIKIPLPPMVEQEIIATILSEIDKIIEKELCLKTTLTNMKNGLMEKLLTGKIRVSIKRAPFGLG